MNSIDKDFPELMYNQEAIIDASFSLYVLKKAALLFFPFEGKLHHEWLSAKAQKLVHSQAKKIGMEIKSLSTRRGLTGKLKEESKLYADFFILNNYLLQYERVLKKGHPVSNQEFPDQEIFYRFQRVHFLYTKGKK